MVLYLLGVVTPFVLLGLWLLVLELTQRNLEITCSRCGKIFGMLSTEADEYGQKPTLTYVTRVKFKWHKRSCT